MSELFVAPDVERLARIAAEQVTALAAEAVARRGRFVLALAGGSTPRPTYRLLAQGQAIDWTRVELLFGDERCVPPDHPESNYGMVRRALIEPGEIAPGRVHRIRGELPPSEAAVAYESELRTVLGKDGRFDLVLLGLGADGHTASLFSRTDAVRERERRAVAVYVRKLDAWRVTLTLPVINRARHVMFLVAGAQKAEALARVWGGEDLPAAMVRPERGTLTWLADREAGALIGGMGTA